MLKVILGDSIFSKVFREGCCCVVGHGNRIRFWHDPWLDAMTLHFRYPRIFALSLNKNSKVGELGSFHNGKWQWDLGLRRSLFDWEISKYNELLAALNAIIPCDEYDSIIWTGAADGVFTVKNRYAAIELRIYRAAPWLISKQCIKITPPQSKSLCLATHGEQSGSQGKLNEKRSGN